MLKANPIIIGDKCNIQDGVVFHGHRMLNGTYPVEIPGEKCMGAQTKLSEYMVTATEEIP
jgi:carbonic anhydrase/acetyltransferase-like protein (isoleucine patch superfamily)